MRSFLLSSLLSTLAIAQYPANYVDFGGNFMAGMNVDLNNFPKPPVQTDTTGGTGQHKANMFTDPGLPGFTMYAPTEPPAGQKLPVLIFGNGGCLALGQMFANAHTEIASHGYYVIALGGLGTNVTISKNTDMFDAINYVAKNAGTGKWASADATKFAVGGQSCGAWQAMTASQDPRVKALMIVNSGLMGATLRPKLEVIKVPTAFILGGWFDAGYSNGLLDYDAIRAPVLLASKNVGHMGTFDAPHGGEFAVIMTNFLDWQLKGNETAKGLFTDPATASLKARGWTEFKMKNFT